MVCYLRPASKTGEDGRVEGRKAEGRKVKDKKEDAREGQRHPRPERPTGGARGLCPVYPPPPYNAEDLHLSALCQRRFAGIAVHDGSSFKIR